MARDMHRAGIAAGNKNSAAAVVQRQGRTAAIREEGLGTTGNTCERSGFGAGDSVLL